MLLAHEGQTVPKTLIQSPNIAAHAGLKYEIWKSHASP